MVRRLNAEQQIYIPTFRPKVAYQRVESVIVFLSGPPVAEYALTPKVGNDVWLTAIDIWPLPRDNVSANYTVVLPTAGTGDNPSDNDVQNWDICLPMTNNNNQQGNYIIYEGAGHMRWEMERLYTGEARRFSLYCYKAAGNPEIIQCAFTISEG